VHIESFADPAAFLAAATPFLVVEEAVHCILLGVPGDMVRFGTGNPDARFWMMRDDRGAVSGAALQTPPLSLAVSRMSRDGAVALAAELQGLGVQLPGVRGPLDAATAFAEAWTRRTGMGVEAVGGGEHAWQLSRSASAGRADVVPPTGQCVRATGQDLDAIGRWAAGASAAFGESPGHWSQNIELAVREQQLYLWRDDEPVAMAMLRGETPRGVRVSGVFTPLVQRGKGYATALVGAISEEALRVGREFCFLFTDASNKTAEGIYARLGYRAVATCQQYRFVALGGPE